VLRRLRQEDLGIKASLDYRQDPISKKIMENSK
jgi:hypothetical protein